MAAPKIGGPWALMGGGVCSVFSSRDHVVGKFFSASKLERLA